MHRRMIRSLIAVVCFLALWKPSMAQQDSSLFTLSEQQFLAIVRAYNPIVKQAALNVESAAAILRETRGAFDPQLGTNFERKTFDDLLYYSYFNPEIVIPTWYGIEIYGGLEEIFGDKPANVWTLGQSSYLGVSIPLAKDLVIDKRRAVLRQAKLFQQQAEVDRINTVNDLLNESLADYWTWVREYQVYRVIREAVAVNEARFRYIRIEAQQGLRPAIDTTEALTQLQQFQYLESEALVRYQNAGLILSTYMWLEGDKPFNWSPRIVPDSSWLGKSDWNNLLPPVEELVTEARLEHPKLRSYEFKLDGLDIEKRLKFQSLLPKMDLKYNLLNKGYNVFNKVDGAFLENNYKIGFDFKMPLLLRQGRGAYQQAKIKIRQTNLDRDLTGLQIENKVRQYYNELMALRNQIRIYEDAYENYLRLFRGEDLKFKIGESSLFLLNARENKALEALQKVYDLKTKWYKNYVGLLWSGGKLR